MKPSPCLTSFHPFAPAGDQPQAIARLTADLVSGAKHQTLLGVTGSGKTFTVANVIAQRNRPTLVLGFLSDCLFLPAR